jgi:hypothetical protein
MELLDALSKEVVQPKVTQLNLCELSTIILTTKRLSQKRSLLWITIKDKAESSIGTTTETFIISSEMPLLTYNAETTLINGPLWETGLLLHATESFLFPLSALILF